MSPFAIALIVVATIMAGALLGSFLRSRLPQHHLDNDTKDTVKIGIAFLTTLAALVLGLIIASAKGSFDTKSEEVQAAAATISLLDNNLRQLGSAADPVRDLLRQIVAARIRAIWGSDDLRTGMLAAEKPGRGIVDLQNALGALSPAGEAQRAAWLKARQLVDDLAQLKSLAIAHLGSSITMPLLGLLVFWLVLIALGLNLFAPRNAMIYALDVVYAVSAAGAIFLILEMDRPFGGLIELSDAPLRAVLLQLNH